MHTFGENTLKALYEETSIRVISDTIANDVYYKNNFCFIPLQSGSVRNLPFETLTFCYHPNIMEDKEFIELDRFIINNGDSVISFNVDFMCKRKRKAYEKLAEWIYFIKNIFREIIKRN